MSNTARRNISAADAESVERLAQKIAALKLELPARFFLEAHLPLVSLIHTAGLFAEPFAVPLFGADRMAAFRSFFSSRENIEALLERLTGLEDLRMAAPRKEQD